ncbi:hypothetical protein ACFW3Z_16255 [Nocardiopsis alba]|jgi:hypothetical protein|uniref:hypothetical protein n=1 Tax=Nocardiopsis alba TaxID=53437 RepID=UPI0033B28388
MAIPTEYIPSPTEVIEAWIPHDSRWHAQARSAARAGVSPLRAYVMGLVRDHRDGHIPITDDYDLASLGAVSEDLSDGGGAHRILWDRVQNALLLPDRNRL